MFYFWHRGCRLLVSGVGDSVGFGIIDFCRTRLIEIKDQVSRADIMFEITMPTTERSGRIGWTDGFVKLVVGSRMYRSEKSLTLDIKFIEEGESL